MSESKPVKLYPVTARSWAEGQGPGLIETPGPIRWRVGVLSQPGFLWRLKSCHVWMAIYQPNPLRTNLTRLAVLFMRRDSKTLPETITDAKARALPWKRRKCYRMKGKREGTLQLRLGRPELKVLPRSVPTGTWIGHIGFDAEDPEAADFALMELERETVRRPIVEAAAPRIVVPPPTEVKDKALPRIVLP